MPVYDSATLYINSATTIKDKIIKIDEVIAALLTTAITAAEKDNISEYWLNDGQIQIKTSYRGAESVLKSIKGFELIRAHYLQQLNPRVTKLVDSKSFRNY